MTKQMRCECGFIARADSDDEVVAVITGHMRTEHPDVLAGVDPHDVYGWVDGIHLTQHQEMPMTTVAFDAHAYKATTREQWQSAATAWDRWEPTIESWLGPATQVMLDLARVHEGGRVLDVAAGTGGQTIAGARRVGPTGRLPATDVAPAILALAERNARQAGLNQVAVQEMDGEDLAVDPGAFDAVISRVGLIYFPDRARAPAGMRAALRPGGRLAAVVYSPRRPMPSSPPRGGDP